MLSRLCFILVLVTSHLCFAYELSELLDSRLDPSLEYRTLKSKHIEVHFPDYLTEVAQEVFKVAQKSYGMLTQHFGFSNKNIIHIVVADRSDQTGVFALTFPHNQIFYDISLPPYSLGLNVYGQWHNWLLTHELVHLLQLEHRSQFYDTLESVFGSFVLPNASVPVWYKEGLATFIETKLTRRGRGDGPYYEMMMRVASDEHQYENLNFANMDSIHSTFSTHWPWTERSYLIGYYLAEQIEKESPGNVELIKRVGKAFPYTFERQLYHQEGRILEFLWEEVKNRLNLRYKDQIQSIKDKGLTEIEYLTDSGYYYHGLELAPNEDWLLTTHINPDEETHILKLDLSEQPTKKEKLVYRSTGYQVSFSSSSRFISFDQSSRYRRHNTVSSLYIYDLKEKKYVSVSPPFRAKEADIHPNGKEVVFITNNNGRNQLVMTDTNWQNGKDLLGDIGYSRLSSPRFSPDGSSIVVVKHNEKTGGEDLVLVTNGEKRTLIANGSLNLFPSWNKTGEILYYSSDLSGVFNIYAHDFRKKKVFKLTNVLGGVLAPVFSEKRKSLYVLSYRDRGYDVAKINEKNLLWQEVDPTEFDNNLKMSLKKNEFVEKVYSSIDVEADSPREYGALSYLKPQYLVPSALFLPESQQFGLTLGSVDPLYFYHYELTVRHDSATNQAVGNFYYFNGRSKYSYDLNISREAFPVFGDQLLLESTKSIFGVNIPIHDHFTRYYLRPELVMSNIELLGNQLYYGPGLTYKQDTQFTQHGLSFPEQGRLYKLSYRYLISTDSDLGDQSYVTGKTSHHFPISGRHVLHLDFEGGTFLSGRDNDQSLFYVGGQKSFPISLESEFHLNGYPPNTFLVRDVGLLSARYTFSLSLLDKKRSIWLPLYLKRLSGGIVAQVASLNGTTSEVPWSIGLELFQDFDLAHMFPLKASLGLYQGNEKLNGQTQLVFSIGGKY